jgi:hypothetical protein
MKAPDMPQESKRNCVQKKKKKKKKTVNPRVSGKVLTEDEWATRKQDIAGKNPRTTQNEGHQQHEENKQTKMRHF